MNPEFIDSVATLRSFIDNLPTCDETWLSLYIDLEGNGLCRSGTLALFNVLVEPRRTVHIVDVTRLGNDAFVTEGADGRSLKSILESGSIIKVFFDIRNDSDALFSHHGISVAGIEDLQLLELASRRSSKRIVHGLAKCIENDADISYQAKREWREIKNQGRRLFVPEHGGCYAVFDQRPLLEEIKQYCAQDLLLLPCLHEVYITRLCDAWWVKVEQETAIRISLSQSPTYNGKGRHMALEPPSWSKWIPSPGEWNRRALLDAKRYTAEPGKSKASAAGSPLKRTDETTPSSAISGVGPSREDQPGLSPNHLIQSFNEIVLQDLVRSDVGSKDDHFGHGHEYSGYEK